MKTTVIYHRADFDGLFCREIAKKFLPPETEFIGWDFADPPLLVPGEGTVYVLDLPCDRPFGFHFGTGGGNKEQMEAELVQAHGNDISRFVWIDHHKSSIETHPTIIPGYRIDGVAASRLAWQWFIVGEPEWRNSLPQKQDFLDRKVQEPLAVRLAGEYDIWDKRDPRAETFQYALRVADLTDAVWKDLLTPSGIGNDQTVEFLLRDGFVAQKYARQTDESICKHKSFLLEWEGLRWLCINTARFNSLFFASRDVRETRHDALLGFSWDGRTWTVSLYHAAHNKEIDLSQIAIKYGGGGHAGACGFTTKTLPLPL